MSEGATTLTEEEVKARINGLDLSEEGDKYKFLSQHRKL